MEGETTRTSTRRSALVTLSTSSAVFLTAQTVRKAFGQTPAPESEKLTVHLEQPSSQAHSCRRTCRVQGVDQDRPHPRKVVHVHAWTDQGYQPQPVSQELVAQGAGVLLNVDLKFTRHQAALLRRWSLELTVSMANVGTSEIMTRRRELATARSVFKSVN